LVHLKGEADELGHYVVWLSSSFGQASVWYGKSGLKTIPDRELMHRSSGFILLTSDEPITDPGQALASRTSAEMVVTVTSAILAAIGVAILCRRQIGCVFSCSRRKEGTQCTDP
jgi:hypothetical protein